MDQYGRIFYMAYTCTKVFWGNEFVFCERRSSEDFPSINSCDFYSWFAVCSVFFYHMVDCNTVLEQNKNTSFLKQLKISYSKGPGILQASLKHTKVLWLSKCHQCLWIRWGVYQHYTVMLSTKMSIRYPSRFFRKN